jgi:hypothetical protein
MRLIALVSIAAAVAGCTATPPPGAPDMRGQMMLAQMLQGKVAGAPQRCLQVSQTRDLVPIDATTLAYRDGATTWINHVEGYCGGLQTGGTLVTRPDGPSGPCSGDMARVVDFAGMTTGSCLLGPFVPYRSR